MTPRTDLRQTKMMFLNPDGLWSVSTPFLDEVPGILVATLGREFVTRPISSVLVAAVSAPIEPLKANPYLDLLAEMFGAVGDHPFLGTAILTGGFVPPTRTSSGGWNLPKEWVIPINEVLVLRVKGIVAQHKSSQKH